MEKCIFWQSKAYSMQNFDIFCPSVPAMVCIWAKRKLVKFYGYFSQHNFEKLIWTLKTTRQSVSSQYLLKYLKDYYSILNFTIFMITVIYWVSGILPGDSCVSELLFILHEFQPYFDSSLEDRAVFLDIQILWQDLASMSLI